MPQAKTLFGNFLDTEDVIDERLEKFSVSAYNRLKPIWPDIAEEIHGAIAGFQAERVAVDGSSQEKRGSVSEADAVLKNFAAYMRIAEHGLVWQLKTSESPVYDAFFPNGLEEYGKVNKTTMPLLSKRVKEAALKYASELPTDMAGRMQEFEGEWEAAFGKQESGKGQVVEHRDDRSDARIKLEEAMLTAMHLIAAKHPGKVEECSRFFELNLLKAARHSSLERPAANA